MEPAPEVVPEDPDGFRAEVAVALHATAEVFRDRNLRRAQLVLATFTFLDVATWLALLGYAYVDGGASAVGVVALVLLIPAAMPSALVYLPSAVWRRSPTPFPRRSAAMPVPRRRSSARCAGRSTAATRTIPGGDVPEWPKGAAC